MILIILCVFLSVFSFIRWSSYGRMMTEDRIQNRLRDISTQMEIDHASAEHQGMILTRIAGFLADKVISTLSRLMPESMNIKLNQKLAEAGLSHKITWREWRLISLLVGIVLPIVSAQAFFIMGYPALRAMMTALMIGLGSQLVMRYVLIVKARSKQARIVAELPDILDLITVSVEAGLSFDGAIDRVATEAEGPLADEFGQTLKELRMGKTRRDALRRMSDRCAVPDLTALVGSIIQADELGVAIGKILRIQSEQMRERRKQRAREKSMKAPIKMLFPLLMFIFPAILVVILGPAILQLMDMFM